jgi:hypothetical protein
MANPQSGNVSLVEVGRDLMMASGNVSLSDVKYKDAAKKTNTSVSLGDFRKLVWGNGRTEVSSQDIPASNIRPHHYDLRHEVHNGSGVTSGVTFDGDNGSPRWFAYWGNKQSVPVASYLCGYAKVTLPSSTSMRVSLDMSSTESVNKGGRARLTVVGYSNGYLSGSQKELLPYVDITRDGPSGVKSFTYDPAYPHLLIAVEGWTDAFFVGSSYGVAGNFGISNFKVYLP